jgi:hypothetical protein
VLVLSASGQRVVVLGLGVVCSRVASGYSGRGVRKRVIAAKLVSVRRGAGVVVERASGIAARTAVANGGGVKVGGIGSASASGPRRQLRLIRCVRASAQHREAKFFWLGGVNGRVAMSTSRSSRSIRAGVFVVWRVAWRCVACWIARRVTGPGGGAGVVRA